MSDETVLPELVRRESRSFLQYIREAFPFGRGKDEAVRDAILRIANAEAEHAAKLGRLLQKRHIPLPNLGAFPTNFTSCNFLDARSLVPRLVATERQAIADLDRDLFLVTDGDVRSQLEAYRDLKRGHLGELESLSAT